MKNKTSNNSLLRINYYDLYNPCYYRISYINHCILSIIRINGNNIITILENNYFINDNLDYNLDCNFLNDYINTNIIMNDKIHNYIIKDLEH